MSTEYAYNLIFYVYTSLIPYTHSDSGLNMYIPIWVPIQLEGEGGPNPSPTNFGP